MLIFRPFKIGDYVVSGSYEGTVTGINIFYTTMRTVDNKKVLLPNGTLSNAALVNVTAEDTRRVDLTYTVSFESDLEKTKKVLQLVANSDSRVLKDPAVSVVVGDYADGAWNLRSVRGARVTTIGMCTFPCRIRFWPHLMPAESFWDIRTSMCIWTNPKSDYKANKRGYSRRGVCGSSFYSLQ